MAPPPSYLDYNSVMQLFEGPKQREHSGQESSFSVCNTRCLSCSSVARQLALVSVFVTVSPTFRIMGNLCSPQGPKISEVLKGAPRAT
jgi:hypothetical protein